MHKHHNRVIVITDDNRQVTINAQYIETTNRVAYGFEVLDLRNQEISMLSHRDIW